MEDDTLPLAVLAVSENQAVSGITRFQKLVFLAQEELDRPLESYEFDSHKYGPFSKELYDDIDDLVEKGLATVKKESTNLGEDKQVYRLTEEGETRLKNQIVRGEFGVDVGELSDTVRDYDDMGLWPLLKYVYREYPEMAENSTLNIGIEETPS